MFFFSKCSRDIIISYVEENTIVCTKFVLTQKFVMSLDSVDAKNNEIRVKGNDMPQGGTLILFILRFRPSIYHSPQKNIRSFTPKKYLKF